MGSIVDPNTLTESGEKCLARLCELSTVGLPPAQFVTVIGTVVEGHVSRILARLIVLSDVDSNPLGRALLAESVEKMDRNWPERHRWLKDAFSLGYAGTSAYEGFTVLVAARNAVVHGDGSLTGQQANDMKKLIVLRKNFQKKLDATLHGRLSFGDASAAKAMDIARNFVTAFDAEVLANHPDARRL